MNIKSMWLLLLLATIVFPYRLTSLSLPPRVHDIENDNIDTMFNRIRKGRFVEVNQTTLLENTNDMDPLIREKKSSSDHQPTPTVIPPQKIPKVKAPIKHPTIEDSKPVSSNIAPTLIHHPARLQPTQRPLPSFADLTGNTVSESLNCVFEQESCYVDEPLLRREECDDAYSHGEVASSEVLLHANNANLDGSWENFECYSTPCGSEPLLLPNYADACMTNPPYSDIYLLPPDEYT